MNIIGKRIPKLDAGDRVTGKSVYGTDIELPGMLHGSILRSIFPSAIIESIDVSKAKALPGVECVITADDVDVTNLSYRKDHPVLKKDEVNCIRDEIAAVAAVSKNVAEKALELIEVNYIEREGIFDPIEALKTALPGLTNSTKRETAIKTFRNLFIMSTAIWKRKKRKAPALFPGNTFCLKLPMPAWLRATLRQIILL